MREVLSFSAEHHPVGLMSQLQNIYGNDLVLSFSRYFYRPRQLLDERVVFDTPISVVNHDWLIDTISRLDEGWELALNSLVIDGRGRRRHLGMIDFIGRPPVDLVREAARNILGPRVSASLALFDSGRSIHGYSLILMGPSDWFKFLGRLLLMNSPGELPIVDERWVGHRLIGGYSALRWSANSSHHSVVPHSLNRERKSKGNGGR